MTRELKETFVDFLYDDCFWAITEGEKILPKQRNRVVNDIARLMCSGNETLDDKCNVSEMLDSIIYMMAAAYEEGKKSAKDENVDDDIGA